MRIMERKEHSKFGQSVRLPNNLPFFVNHNYVLTYRSICSWNDSIGLLNIALIALVEFFYNFKFIVKYIVGHNSKFWEQS
jgi:hypothetical protein